MDVNTDSQTPLADSGEPTSIENIPKEKDYDPKNMDDTLLRIQQAVSGEQMDTERYDWLVDHASSKEEKLILTGIRNDKTRHRNMFRQIYNELAGETVSPLPETPFVPPDDYAEGIKQILMNGQSNIQNYLKILFAMQSRIHTNWMTQIMTDEMRHSVLFDFLYMKSTKKSGHPQ